MTAPVCHRCGRPMAVRRGYDYFWGCTGYPKCGGKRNLTARQKAELGRGRLRNQSGEGLEALRLDEIPPRGKRQR